jgi:hypothetical protein
MARRKKSDGEPLEVNDGSPGEMAAAKRMQDGEEIGVVDVNPFPVLEPPASGRREKTLEEPIPVFIRDPNGGLRKAKLTGLICYSGTAGGDGTPETESGRSVAHKCPGATLYEVTIDEDDHGRKLNPQDVMRGKFRWIQLEKR